MTKKIKPILLSVVTFVFLVVSLSSSVTTSYAFFGDKVGYGMNKKSISLPRDLPLEDKGLRTYTLNEIFEDSAKFTVPYGTLEKQFFGLISKNEKVINADKSLTEEQKNTLKQQGKSVPNISVALHTIISNLTTMVSMLTASLVTWMVGFLFNPPMVDGIVKIIGGEGKDAGLINTFGTNIFLPLSVLAFLSVGVYLIWEGLIKRRFRASFGALAWALFAFALGVLTITNGKIVAKAPTELNSMIANCILAAGSGESCVGNSSTAEQTTNNLCDAKTNANLSASESAQLNANRFSCIVNKALVYDRFSEFQFGYTLDELWTKDAPDGYTEYKVPAGTEGNYCVNMYSDAAPKNMNANTKFTQNSKCNVALAYFANFVDADFGVKSDFADITALAVRDPVMWNSFSGSGRPGIPIFLLISSFIVAYTFIPVIIYALVYNLTATVLTVFAPLYLLIGIHPGRGRKIFLGWLETIISNILKYMASCFLAIVMIVMYGAVFAKMNQFQVLVSAIVLGATFLAYRKELVNLIGAVNMGGAKVANVAEERLNKTKQQVGNITSSVVGGAIGGTIASVKDAKDSGENISVKKVLNDGLKGVGKATNMELKRGRGVVASVARQASQVGSELKQERRDSERELLEDKRRQQANEITEEKMTEVAESYKAQDLENHKDKVREDEDTTQTIQDLSAVGMMKAAEQLTDKVDTVEEMTEKADVVSLETEINEQKTIAKELVSEIKNTGNVIDGTDNFAKNKANEIEDKYLNEAQRILDTVKNKPYQAEAEQLVNEKINQMASRSEDFKEDMIMIARDEKGVDLERVTSSVKDLDSQMNSDFKSLQDDLARIKIDYDNNNNDNQNSPMKKELPRREEKIELPENNKEMNSKIQQEFKYSEPVNPQNKEIVDQHQQKLRHSEPVNTQKDQHQQEFRYSEPVNTQNKQIVEQYQTHQSNQTSNSSQQQKNQEVNIPKPTYTQKFKQSTNENVEYKNVEQEQQDRNVKIPKPKINFDFRDDDSGIIPTEDDF